MMPPEEFIERDYTLSIATAYAIWIILTIAGIALSVYILTLIPTAYDEREETIMGAGMIAPLGVLSAMIFLSYIPYLFAKEYKGRCYRKNHPDIRTIEPILPCRYQYLDLSAMHIPPVASLLILLYTVKKLMPLATNMNYIEYVGACSLSFILPLIGLSLSIYMHRRILAKYADWRYI